MPFTANRKSLKAKIRRIIDTSMVVDNNRVLYGCHY